MGTRIIKRNQLELALEISIIILVRIAAAIAIQVTMTGINMEVVGMELLIKLLTIKILR